MQWLSVKNGLPTQRSVPARILFWLALIMVLAWLLARWWGITDPLRITRGQRKLLIAAGVLFTISWLPLPRFPKFICSTPLAFPGRIETIILGVLALIIVTVDILWSLNAGLLAYPPFYDGIGYLFDAKRSIHLLGSLVENPQVLRDNSAVDFSFSPLWKILIMLHYWVLGSGEWQAYSVRFWPTLLLLLLIRWSVGQHGNLRLAWTAVWFTALLPTLIVSVRTALLQFYFPGSSAIGWYIADLRPDLLFAVLLAWAAVPLLQFTGHLDSRLWLISGIGAALALMTKPSALTLLVLAWGLAFVVVLLVNRTKLKETLSTSIWGFGTFLLFVTPWIVFGGLARILRYIYRSAVSHRELWSDASATLWSEFTYYWQWYSVHMGLVEGWLFLACALIAFFLRLTKGATSQNIASGSYLVIGLVLYGVLSASPSKNYFLGLPFFLILWIFSWTTLSHVWGATADKKRPRAWLPTLTATIYVAAILLAFGYAVKHWPTESIRSAAQTRATTGQMVNDLDQVLGRSDKFLSAPLFGIPATFQYYMIQRDGYYPRQCPFDPLASPPERVVENLQGDCKAILLYGGDEDQRKLSPAPRAALARWEAVAAWVKNPHSGYRLRKRYQIYRQSPWTNIANPNSGFTMELYVLETPASKGADS